MEIPAGRRGMNAWQAFDEARRQAFEAGKRGRKGNGARYLKTHPAPAVTVEQLLAEAYALGYWSAGEGAACVTGG